MVRFTSPWPFVAVVSALLAYHTAAQTPGELKWSAPGALHTGPVLGTNGLVYGASEQGRVYAWETGTGTIRWETNVSGFTGGMTVGPNNHLYVSSSEGLHALDGNTGSEMWHQSEAAGAAVGGDGTVFVSDYEGILALDPLNGRPRWVYFGQLMGNPVPSANGLVFTLASLGRVLALDGRTGKLVWDFQQRETYFQGLVMAGDGTVLARGSADGTHGWQERLVALDGATGEQLWQFGSPDQISEIVIGVDDAIWVATFYGGVHVLDPATGEKRRELPPEFALVTSLALAEDGTLYVAANGDDGRNQVFALNGATGGTNWVFAPPDNWISEMNIGTDGTVYFRLSNSGSGLYAVNGTSALANTAWPKAFQNAQNTSQWKVTGAPTITRQPRSHWAAMDRSTAFHFYSPVMRPMHIQWRFNGEPIAGATNEILRIEPVRFADAGSYSVAVSNESGAAISEEATLSVGYTLALTTIGPGSVRRVPELAVYPTNAVVELTAVPATNRNFLGWSGDANGGETLTLRMDRNRILMATFEYLRGDVKRQLPMEDISLSADGTLAYGRTIYRYIAAETATGRIVWEVESGAENYSPPVVGRDGTVYYTSYGDALVALDGRTGARKWGFDIGVCTSVPAAVGADGTVYFGGRKLYAIDPTTGTEKWSVGGAGGFLAIGLDGAVYAASSNGVSAYNGETGEKVRDFAEVLPGAPSPTIGPDNTVYIGSDDWKTYAFNGYTGEKRWVFTNGVRGAPIIGPDGTVYTSSARGMVLALDGETGEPKWEANMQGLGAITADGTLLLATWDRLVALDTRDGEVLWESDTNGYPGPAGLNVGRDGTIYLGNSALHGTSPLAGGGWPRTGQNSQNTFAQTVSGAPTITRAPASDWAAKDGTTTFRFYSPVSRPVHVQWQFNGSDIPGATNEVLTLRDVQFANGGSYSVVLSNEFGVASSPAAILNIGYELAVTVEGLGTVQRTPDLTVYPTNSVVQLTARPLSPRAFVGWTGDSTAQTNGIEVALIRNHRLTANFEYLSGDKKWEFVTSGNRVESTPAIDQAGTLYFTSDETLYAVAGATKKWEHRPATGSPALGADGTVFVGSGSTHVYALDPNTGEVKWASLLGIHERVWTSPAIGIDGTVYIAARGGLYALDSATGIVKWALLKEGGFQSSPAVGADGTVYCASLNGRIYAVNRTGAIRWEFQTGHYVTASPAIGADGTVYLGSWDRKVYALDGTTGAPKWEFTTSGNVRSSAAIGPDGTVYVGADYRNLYALDGVTGEQKWPPFQPVGSIGSSPALGADGTVYIGSGDGRVSAVDAATGELKWDAVLSQWQGTDASPTLGPDDTLYIGSGTPGLAFRGAAPLVAIHAPSGLAASPWPKFRGYADNRSRVHSRPLFDAGGGEIAPGGFHLLLHTEFGEAVEVESSDDMRTWRPIATRTNWNGPIQILDTNAPASRRFYRADAVR